MLTLLESRLSVAAILVALVVGLVSQQAAAGTFPSWDSQFNGPARFVVLNQFGGAAVLDKETGLVWEQSPSTSTFTWEAAQFRCNPLTTGNRLGWRIPTIQELASLVDPTQSNPTLPSGHPFSSVQSSPYWSATAFAGDTNGAWELNFLNGSMGLESKDGFHNFVWCVRGGQGVDLQ